MNALHSPLEALDFNYLSYGLLTAVNSIWPLVAVLTAAVSFWRIRALSSSKLVRHGSSPDGASTSSSSSLQTDEGVAAAEAAEDLGDGEVAKVSSTQFDTEYLLDSNINMKCRVLEREGSTKGKFTLYYCDKDECRMGEGGDNGGENGARVVAYEKTGRWCNDWERMMMVKMADMGWYQYQDLSVLDGSVVRLWDSQRRRSAAVVGGVRW